MLANTNLVVLVVPIVHKLFVYVVFDWVAVIADPTINELQTFAGIKLFAPPNMPEKYPHA
jgi:hypothetical protein